MAQTRQEINKRVDEWQRQNVRRVIVKLNKRTDADILAELETKDSIQGYIKEAIREKMSK